MIGFIAGQIQFRKDRLDVLFDRAFTDKQSFGDGAVRSSFRHQTEHFALTLAELNDPVIPAAANENLLDDLRIEHRATRRDAFQVRDELADIGHAFLQQIADPAGAAGDEIARVPLFHILRKDQHGSIGHPLPRFDRGAQALVLEARGHTHVDDRHVGSLTFDRGDEIGTIADGRRDFVTGIGEEANDPFAQENRILGYNDPHGMTAFNVVGPPAGLLILSEPSSASTRLARPIRPVPFAGSAPPLPLSLTVTTSMSGSR